MVTRPTPEPVVLHRIDYRRWGLHAEAGKLGQIVVCLKCGQKGVCKLSYERVTVAGKPTAVPKWDKKVIHAGELQEVLKGTTRETVHVAKELCDQGPKLRV